MSLTGIGYAAIIWRMQHELVLEDLDDEGLGSNISTAFSSSGTSAHQIQAPAGPNRLFTNSSSSNVDSSLWGTAGGLGAADLQPLLPEQQRQLSTLLWGDANARPDAAWGQGLVFSTVKGLEWGLVQSAGWYLKIASGTAANAADCPISLLQSCVLQLQ